GAVRAVGQQAEMDVARLGSDRDHLEERCRQELSKSIEQARQEAGAAFASFRPGSERASGVEGDEEDEEAAGPPPADAGAGNVARSSRSAQAAADAAEAAEGEAPPPFDPVACEDQVRQSREKIEGPGRVNMMALEQFSELEERHRFIPAQQQDLVASIESLRETIRKINRSSREQFVEAFDRIRANFD